MYKLYSINNLNLTGNRNGYLVGPQRLLNEKDGGRVFQDHLGIVNGTIYPLNSRHQLYHSPLYSSFKYDIEKCSKSVGRLYSRYQCDTDPSDIQWCIGCGFCVSPEKVLTLYHLVKPLCYKEDRVYKLTHIFIYFGVDATEGEVHTTTIHKNPYAYELVHISDRKVDGLFPDSLPLGGRDDLPWDTMNDFTFLQFSDLKKVPKDLEYVLPQFPITLPSANEIYLIGYPSKIKYSKFNEDNPNAINIHGLYRWMKHETKRFQHKVVSFSEGVFYDSSLSIHKCPSLRGQAGGLLGNFFTDSKFVGIHLGGTKENNMAISVGYPSFVYLYFQYIASDRDFFKKHQNDLREYQLYYETIKNEHPDGDNWV
ncbi:hypothetical protein DLAC_07083 [Tieghemostelium lacteum]|uniref:Uncharacterized protein n=1 Tax=Tieghemostelium lacteum TaxID=361077 RepID=A0A151ZE51_TIELA|nr:hypothetical protein DLAC_07083 [Tieghemostelium lacteum]|eukprot:KYQ92236.1 hypothetical protein DLAC_07083 [Tieghemostelium lacteum]